VQRLCTDGPAEGHEESHEGKPPEAWRVEYFPEAESEDVRAVEPGTEFPTIKAEVYGYRLKTMTLAYFVTADGPPTELAHYVYDETLDPEIIDFLQL
jgi:hypothetical protein